MSTFPWTAEQIAKLTALWAEGLSTAEIGRRLGCSKNAAVGKAHRIGLPDRTSPILPRGSGVKPRNLPPLPAKAVTLPQFNRWCRQCGGILGAGRDKFCTSTCETIHGLALLARKAPPKPIVIREEEVPATTFKPLPSRPCCWPIGEPRAHNFRYCDEPSNPGKPYCIQHCSVAYVTRRDLRDAA